MRNYSILVIKIIGPWPLDPLMICLAKINLNFIYIHKEKIVWGGEKSIIFVKQRLAKLLGRRPPPLPPRHLRPWSEILNFVARTIGLYATIQTLTMLPYHVHFPTASHSWRAADALFGRGFITFLVYFACCRFRVDTYIFIKRVHTYKLLWPCS